MGKTWAAQVPAAARVFAEADAALGFELSRVCFEGPEERIHRTDVAQPALFTTAVACFRGLEARGEIGALGAAAGLSLGEFTALHLAGAFDFLTGLKLVRVRGQAMQEAAEASESGMVALVGADEEQAGELCTRALEGADSGTHVLVPANFNCPGQVVLSGSAPACDRAMVAAEQMGLRATRLSVAGAFHSPLMKPAADRLARALEEVEFSPPAIPVLSNVTGEPHGADTGAIKERLVDQLTQPVRWEQDIRWLLGNASGQFVELAPGKVLSGLMRRIDRGTKVKSCPDPDKA